MKFPATLASALIATGLATAAETPLPALPFSVTVTEEKIENRLDYMGPGNPVDMDFPYNPLFFDGEFWVMYKNGYVGPVLRYKGTHLENAVRQPDGALTGDGYAGAPYLLGGMWYDANEKKLYAPTHNEVGRYTMKGSAYAVERQIHLVSSVDKGLTWVKEGLIIGRDDPKSPRQPHAFSGLYWDGGEGDHHIFVDERGGFIYLYTLQWLHSKRDVGVQFLLQQRVARCAIADKMAPGKWRRFYNGAWNEPGVGGKSSCVNAHRVTYNTYLKKYLSFSNSSCISMCDDLNKQEWSPLFNLGNYWCSSSSSGAIWVTDAQKSDVFTSGQEMLVYNFLRKQPGRRFRVTLGQGETRAARGFASPSMHFSLQTWDVGHETSMNPGQQYPFEPVLDSEDPIHARRTRRVGSWSQEVRYAGAWTERSHPSFYEGKAKAATVADSSIELTFRGKEIYWRAVQGPDQGKADVFIDGTLQATVDCWASDTSVRQFAFIKRDLSENKPHTIKVVVRNDKNKLSSGTAIQHLLFEYAAETYRASDCFSSIQGKNQWRYQQRTGAAVTDLASFSDPLWKGTEECAIGYYLMVPAVGVEAVRTWSAPRDGTVRVEGTPVPVAAGDVVFQVGIRKGNAEIWPLQSDPKVPPAASHDLTVTVRKGDTLSFIAGRNGTTRPDAAGTGLTVLANNDKISVNSIQGKPLKIGNQEYERGLFCHAVSNVSARVSGPAKEFSALVGANGQMPAGSGSMVFIVSVGGKIAFRSEVLKAGMPAVPVRIPLESNREFQLQVSDAGDGISSDQAIWADAKVTLADGKEVWLSDLPVSQARSPGPQGINWDPVVTYVDVK